MYKNIILLLMSFIFVACGGGGSGGSSDGGNGGGGTNNTPLANAGTDWGTPVGSNATLDSSSSNDADGDALTYSWTLSAPTGSSAFLSDPTAANPTFITDIAGNYTATLIVNDGTVDSSADSVTVKVGPFNFADYQPLDSSNTCASTMEVTLGSNIGQQYDITIGGTDTVEYTSGALTGVIMNNYIGDAPNIDTLAYNDGASFKILKFTDPGVGSIILSTDCKLSAHPDEWSFGTIFDGMIKDQTSIHREIGIDAVTSVSECRIADNASQKILIKIQDVTVQGTLFQNAVIWYWLDFKFSYTTAGGLDFSGKDTEFGLTLPTIAETDDGSPTAVDIYAFGSGTIVGGDIDASDGMVPHIAERISTTCP